VIGIGIDFGTSNSSAAIFDGETLRYVRLGPEAIADDEGVVIPTALYMTRDLQASVGLQAIADYVADNAGRSVTLTRQHVGAIEIVVAGTDRTAANADGTIEDVADVHAFTDLDMPGRLFRSLKRWLGDPNVERVRVFAKPYRIVALVTPILLAMREAIQRLEPPRRVHVGRPVNFEGRDPSANRVATDRLSESYGYAGFPKIAFYPEPTAAALSWLHGREPSEAPILAFDFGGGTLDLCVIRTLDDRFEILSTAGIGLGGDAIDMLIYRDKVFPALGEGALVESNVVSGPRKIPFNFGPFESRLLNWTASFELNRPELLEMVAQGAREAGDAGLRLGRLHALIVGNHNYGVFQAIERAKIELSQATQATIEVPEIDLALPIRRDEFDLLLEDVLPQIDAVIALALEKAGLSADEIGCVVGTGGSSQIPAVQALLSRTFPGRIVEHDPFTSIASGLAIASYLGLTAEAT
jgi:hypothetical chaperone protein